MSHERRRTFAKNRLPIVDQAALTEVLEELIDEDGSQEAAAGSIGVDPGTYSKLRRGKRAGIEFATYERIAARLGRTVSNVGEWPSQALEFPVDRGPPPATRESEKEGIRRIREVNQAWEEMLVRGQAFRASCVEYLAAAAELDEAEPAAREERSGPSPPPEHSEAERRRNALWRSLQRAVLTESQLLAWDHYEAWLSAEIRRIEDQGEPVLEDLWANERYRRSLADFLARVGRRPDRIPDRNLDGRCRLALLRAVAPLGAVDDSWRMEYGWKDLHKLGELESYLSAALRKEALLFDPVREMERVRRARLPEGRDDSLGAPDDDLPDVSGVRELLALVERQLDKESGGSGDVK